jgi:hypothetical protein
MELGRLARAIAPINVLYDIAIAGILVIVAGQGVNMLINLHYLDYLVAHMPNLSGRAMRAWVSEYALKKSVLPATAVLFLHACLIALRVMRKREAARLPLSILIYSVPTSVIFGLFFMAAVLSNNMALVSDLPRSLIFAVVVAVPWGVAFSMAAAALGFLGVVFVSILRQLLR